MITNRDPRISLREAVQWKDLIDMRPADGIVEPRVWYRCSPTVNAEQIPHRQP